MTTAHCLQVRRSPYLVNDTLLQIQNASANNTLKRPLKVQFIGEQGVDEGGVQKVWNAGPGPNSYCSGFVRVSVNCNPMIKSRSLCQGIGCLVQGLHSPLLFRHSKSFCGLYTYDQALQPVSTGAVVFYCSSVVDNT